MKIELEQLQMLIDFLQDCLDTEITIRTSYSGRGMCGKICFGIVGRFNDIMTIYTNWIATIVREGHEELISLFQVSSLDSMGRDSILYWASFDTSNIDNNKLIELEHNFND